MPRNNCGTGKRGIPKALAELQEAVDALFEHTDFDKISRKFFLQQVMGQLKAADEDVLTKLGVKF